MNKQRAVFKYGMLLAVLAFAFGCRYTRKAECGMRCGSMVPDRAEDIRPVLIGQTLPKMVLRDMRGGAVDVNAAVARKPAVLIFYRGGWCPFCNMHLGGLQKIEPDLARLGYEIIAISPDRPEKLKASVDKHKLGYRLLSDSNMAASRSLGIAFRLDDETVNKYKTQYKIDIEGDSGQTHHQLPVPSVFLVGRDGIIRFSYVNPNYKVRLEPAVLLEAAKASLKSRG